MGGGAAGAEGAGPVPALLPSGPRRFHGGTYFPSASDASFGELFGGSSLAVLVSVVAEAAAID